MHVHLLLAVHRGRYSTLDSRADVYSRGTGQVRTGPFGFAAAQAPESEDDGALVLLRDLQWHEKVVGIVTGRAGGEERRKRGEDWEGAL